MIHEADAIQVIRRQLADARAAIKEAITLQAMEAATFSACALVQLARELARSSDLPCEFLRQVGVQS